MIRSIAWVIIFAVAIAGLLACPVVNLIQFAHGRDLDGRYANSPLKNWFDSLRDQNGGFCCSDADGRETEYDIRGDHYWVPVNGTWTEVPDVAVIHEPNKYGRPMVWLWFVDGKQAIRCFIPATGS